MTIILDPAPPAPPTPPPSGDILAPYTSLITSEHNQKTKFMGTIAVLIEPLAETAQAIRAFPADFDLSMAVGTQLDAVGLWVGISRNIPIELENVYFSLDVEGLGLDEGSLIGPNDSISEMNVLPDDAYRNLLRVKIAKNYWDGTISQAISIIETALGAIDVRFVLQDSNDMAMILGLVGAGTDAVTKALFTNGFFDLKPAGVRIERMLSADGPLFGLDIENDVIAGLDVGAFSSI